MLHLTTANFETWQQHWRFLTYTDRAVFLHKIAEKLDENTLFLAQLAAEEIGKPISQGITEVQKCALVCRHFAAKTEQYLATETLETDTYTAEIRYAPLGYILGIMPWNFPFWQVFRLAAPALMAGNGVLIKPAPNVPKCAAALQAILETCLPEGIFKTLFIEIDEVETLIAHQNIAMVSFTGSERAGRAVAALAGKYLKKTVLELGGSDAFIVLADADLAKAAKALILSRFANNGQACNGAKRAFIAETIFDEFINLLKIELAALKRGNPTEPHVFFTRLARTDLAETLQQQVVNSLTKHTRILYQNGDWNLGLAIAPTLVIEVLADVSPDNPLLQEEIFGPVLMVQRVQDTDFLGIIQAANQTNYGLAATVFTQNKETIAFFQERLEVGFLAVNRVVSSDPALPFGGVKNSGFGRELGEAGIKELCNIQTKTTAK